MDSEILLYTGSYVGLRVALVAALGYALYRASRPGPEIVPVAMSSAPARRR